MNSDEAGEQPGAGEPTAVLPETAAQLVELERLQQALADAEERARSNWEQYLRAIADLDNVRKRAQRDIEAANRYGLEKFAAELLPVHESLELAVQTGQNATDVRSVLQVVQPGYEINGRLLRPARVIVAKGAG